MFSDFSLPPCYSLNQILIQILHFYNLMNIAVEIPDGYGAPKSFELSTGKAY